MTDSHGISRIAWRLHVALRVAFVALLVAGVSLLALGRDYGIFVAMFAILCGYAAIFRRCASCEKHFGLAGNFWLAFANPFAVRCIHCGHSVRKPHDA
jgi:hypothetical protein